MGTNSAGNVGSPNEGKTDTNRGSVEQFNVSKASRKTGVVGTPTTVPNSNMPDANKRTVNDPRLV